MSEQTVLGVSLGVARWFARLLPATATAFGGLFVVAGAIVDPVPSALGFLVGLFVLLLGLSTAAAWRWEIPGALAEIAMAIAFGVFVYVTAGHNRVSVALLLPLPWALSGAVLLAIHWLDDLSLRNSRPTTV